MMRLSRDTVETDGQTMWIENNSKHVVRIHGFNRISNRGTTECLVREEGGFIDIEVV